MAIPQLKSVAATVAIILVGIPVVNSYVLYSNGELPNWSALPHALFKGLWPAFWAAVGWILFKSPWSSKLTELLVTQTIQKGDQIDTKTAKLTVNEPAPPRGPNG